MTIQPKKKRMHNNQIVCIKDYKCQKNIETKIAFQSDNTNDGLEQAWYQEPRQWSNSRRQKECNKIAHRQELNMQDMNSTTANYEAINEPNMLLSS